MFLNTNFKRALILRSHLNALLSLAKPFYSGRWLVIFSHVKNAIREVDWTYSFFACVNIAHLYKNQINAPRALIGQSAVGYCAGKPTEKSRVFWIIM